MRKRCPVPYASSLATLREYLHAACEEGLSIRRAGAELRLKGRFHLYYAEAADALGLARRKDGKLQITKLGDELLRSGRGSPDEADVFRRAIEASTVHAVVPDLLSAQGPKGGAAAALYRAGFTSEMARQRGGALDRWRAHILGSAPGPQGELPFAAAKAFEYQGRAMLRRLEIHGFKAFGQGKRGAAVALETAPLTLLAGPNGAGKSTMLQALDVLGALVRGTIPEFLKAHGWAYKDLPHLLSDKQTFGFQVDVALGERELRWSLTLGRRGNPGIAAESVSLLGRSPTVLLDRVGRKVSVYLEDARETVSLKPMTLTQSWLSTLDPKDDREAHPGLLALRAWAERIFSFWSLDPALLRAPSSGAAGLVGPRGGNLASFLWNLKRRDKEAFARFVARVAQYYPRLRDIDVKADGAGMKTLAIHEAWNNAPVAFNANQVSDGLLRLLAVASIPEWEHAPSIVLLDEVENGLHPRLIGGIAQLLEEISKTTQVVATTHSPITLNYVPADHIRLVTRGKGGAVTVTNLTATNGYEQLREHFEPGELWYNVGEERLVGPPPKGRGGRS